MSTFYQDGIITNIDALYDLYCQEEYLKKYLEGKLKAFSETYKISLLPPCLFKEIKAHTIINKIVKEIMKVASLSSIVVALGDAPLDGHFKEAKVFFSC